MARIAVVVDKALSPEVYSFFKKARTNFSVSNYYQTCYRKLLATPDLPAELLASFLSDGTLHYCLPAADNIELWAVTANAQVTPCRIQNMRVAYMPADMPIPQIPTPQQTIERHLTMLTSTPPHSVCCCAAGPTNFCRRHCAPGGTTVCAARLHTCNFASCSECLYAGLLKPRWNAAGDLLPTVFCLLYRLFTVGASLTYQRDRTEPNIPLPLP